MVVETTAAAFEELAILEQKRQELAREFSMFREESGAVAERFMFGDFEGAR